jgi:NhaP-type Na+/H+ or K+/H+ antiporter
MVLVLVFSLALLIAVLLSAAAERTVLSTAVLFLAAGVVAGQAGFGWIDVSPQDALVREASALALYSILLTDGMRVGIKELTRCWELPGRALMLGFPLSLALTAVLARMLVGLPWTESFLLGAILAPTDPVFAAAIVRRGEVPYRLRHLLNVESGVNDGLALPFVAALLATSVGHALADEFQKLALGIAIGIVVPLVAIRLERSRLFAIDPSHRALLAVAVGLIVLAAARLLGGNEFLAAFAAGVTVASAAPELEEDFRDLGESVAGILKFVAILIFGALLSWPLLKSLTAPEYLLAALALFLVRPVTLGIALIGGRLPKHEFAVAAWFGPKGFASVVYAVMVLDAGTPNATTVARIAAVVIAASMVAHSSTDVLVARWLASKTAPRGPRSDGVPEEEARPEDRRRLEHTLAKTLSADLETKEERR